MSEGLCGSLQSRKRVDRIVRGVASDLEPWPMKHPGWLLIIAGTFVLVPTAFGDLLVRRGDRMFRGHQDSKA